MGRGFSRTGFDPNRDISAMSRIERMLQNHKGGKVTMGVDVPRQSEGGVGDMTVRKLGDGLRCYIKTDSGWYDVNNMINQKPLEWFPMDLIGDWQQDTTGGTPSYAKDANGFVHFRGAVEHTSETSASVVENLFTLPKGFRPFNGNISIATCASATAIIIFLIHYSTGVVDARYCFTAGSTSTVWKDTTWLDGMSFFAGDTETSVVGTSTATGGGGSGAGGGGF